MNAGQIDLSDVIDPAAEPLAPVSPGEVLRVEFLEPHGLSASAVAQAIGVPRNRLSAIPNGNRAITADTALRLAIYFRTSAEFWLSLQAGFDLRKTRRETGDRLHREIAPHAA